MSQLVTQNIPNLIGGVSQAAPSLRHPSQCEEQVNCRNDPVEGMGKRPASTLRFNFGLGNSANGWDYPDEYEWFSLFRDEEESYKVAVSKWDVRMVSAKNGYEYNVTYGTAPSGVSQEYHEERIRNYLRRIGIKNQQRTFKVLQAFDTSFILNKSMPVKRKPRGLKFEPASTTEVTRQTISFTRHSATTSPTTSVTKIRCVDNNDGRCGLKYKTHVHKYALEVNGSTYYYDDVQDDLLTVVSWARSTIRSKLASSFGGDTAFDALVQQNGEHLDILVPANVQCDIEGWCQTQNYRGASTSGEYLGWTRKDFVTVNKYNATIADYTPAQPGALWYIKQADYKTKYRIRLNSFEVSIETPEATSTQAREGLQTTSLTADMAQAINDTQASHGCSAQQLGNVIYISTLDGSDFTITSEDDLGSKASYVVKDSIEAFENLPPVAPDGFQVQVVGDPETESDPYYVKFKTTTEAGSNTTGIWTETVGWDVDTELDPYTMPIKLERVQATGTVDVLNPSGIEFILDIFDWGVRTVGDENTAPYPSFVSEMREDGYVNSVRTITDMSIHKNRLVFASQENLIMSEAGDFLNFFPTTTITVLDGDPIDIALNLNTVNPVERIIDSSGKLFLFSPDRQMMLEYNDVLSVKSATVRVLSSYQLDPSAAPFTCGDSIYFWQKLNSNNHLMEFYEYGDGLWTARPVTQHVPTYVKGQPLLSVASPANNTIITMCREDGNHITNKLYVYNYFKEGTELTQSAWQVWEFPWDILDIVFRDGVLVLVTNREKNFGTHQSLTTYCEEISLKGDTPIERELGHKVLMDSLEEVASDFVPDPLQDDLRVTYDYGGKRYAGYPITQEYTFSQLFARDRNDKVLTQGRLQVGHMFLNFTDTTYFRVVIDRQSREQREVTFSGRVIGSLNNLLGEIPIHTGQKSIPIHARSDTSKITIVNDTPQDAVFQTADWEGKFTTRARRM